MSENKKEKFDDKQFLNGSNTGFNSNNADFISEKITFRLDVDYNNDTPDDEKIDDLMIFEEIDKWVKKNAHDIDSCIFSQNEVLDKEAFNDFYKNIRDLLIKKYDIISIFTQVIDYIGINSLKAYSCLGIKFKEELIMELDKRTGILKKLNIGKLF